MRLAPTPHPFDMHGSPEIAGITSQPLLLRLALARLAACRPRAELLLRMSLRRIKQLLAGAALARMAAGRCHRATLRRTAQPQPHPPLALKKEENILSRSEEADPAARPAHPRTTFPPVRSNHFQIGPRSPSQPSSFSSMKARTASL